MEYQTVFRYRSEVILLGLTGGLLLAAILLAIRVAISTVGGI